MPEKTQTITVTGSAPTLLAKAYGSIEQLNWTIKYAGENILFAYTPRKWNKWDDEIKIETRDNELTVTSKLIHNE